MFNTNALQSLLSKAGIGGIAVIALEDGDTQEALEAALDGRNNRNKTSNRCLKQLQTELLILKSDHLETGERLEKMQRLLDQMSCLAVQS